MIDSGLASVRRIAQSADLRIDPHFYVVAADIARLQASLRREGMPISLPSVLEMRGGVNLAESSYDPDRNVDGALYVSVAGVSQFALREDSCQVLREPASAAGKASLAEAAAVDDELLVTRSGTPGIAWPVQLAATERGLIPSGFMIRLRCALDACRPLFLASLLNHPIWRVWSSSLAAGKRQRNLSQEHLRSMFVPMVGIETQEAIGETYRATIAVVAAILTEEPRIVDGCGRVIEEHTGVPVPVLATSFPTVDVVPLRTIGPPLNRALRIDSRFHRGDVRKAIEVLGEQDCVTLDKLAASGPRKGRQPELVEPDTGELDNRVVATASIQAGMVVAELTKLTTPEFMDTIGDRRLEALDLLFCMDGDGSIGKVAVFSGEFPAVTDSHVAIIRLLDPTLAHAIACYLNCRLGQAQVELATSGATGQTQVSVGDVSSILIPRTVLANAAAITASYAQLVGSYQPSTVRIRREIVSGALAAGETLLASGELPAGIARELEALNKGEVLTALLGSLRPDMF